MAALENSSRKVMSAVSPSRTYSHTHTLTHERAFVCECCVFFFRVGLFAPPPSLRSHFPPTSVRTLCIDVVCTRHASERASEHVTYTHARQHMKAAERARSAASVTGCVLVFDMWSGSVRQLTSIVTPVSMRVSLLIRGLPFSPQRNTSACTYMLNT